MDVNVEWRCGPGNVIGWRWAGVVALAIGVLVAMGLRTGEGQELAIAAGVRLVKILLAWLEVWLKMQLDGQLSSVENVVGSGRAAVYVGDGRLAQACARHGAWWVNCEGHAALARAAAAAVRDLAGGGDGRQRGAVKRRACLARGIRRPA